MVANNNHHEDPEVVIESALGRSEKFIEKYGKNLLIALIVIVVGVSSYFGYVHFYKAPKSDKAASALYVPQQQFAKDSFEMALIGFEDVIADFSGTKEANLAAHYAGICCLYTGQYDKAILLFEKFKNQEGAIGELITAQNYGLMGDSYVELGQMDKGVQMYEKAVAYSSNNDTAPVYLKKAALVNESLGNNAKALQQYKTVKSDYAQSTEARDIDKFIARVEQSI